MEFKFEVGNRVQVLEKADQGHEYQDAKIIKKRNNTLCNRAEYLVQRKRLGEKFDEWIEESNLVEIFEEAKHRRDASLESSKPLTYSKDVYKSDVPQRTRRAVKALAANQRKTSKSFDQDYKSVSIKIPIITCLRKKLVEDWILVSQNNEICLLPCRPAVEDVLNAWRDEESIVKPLIIETLQFIKILFDEQLGSQLLYRFERTQYHQILETYPNKSMSSIYGSVHLLRLFVKLPFILNLANLEETLVDRVKSVVMDVMDFMRKNMDIYFSMNYRSAPRELVGEENFASIETYHQSGKVESFS